MKKALILPVLVMLAAGCVQDAPTGKFLANELSSDVCVSSWNCSDWSECIRTSTYLGVQNRTCSDVKGCQVQKEKPQESRVCGLPGASTINLTMMMLRSNELPSSRWTFVAGGEKNISSIERSLGYKEGYYSIFNSTIGKVQQYVSLYPLVDSAINMTFSVDAARSNYRVGGYYENTNKRILTFAEMDNPLVGEGGIAYNISTVDSSGVVEIAYTVCFTKLDVAECVLLEGNRPAYSDLMFIAEKAQTKIV